RIMEVCGTHTMAIARHALRQLLPANVKLVSGPGCPVCVTSAGFIDAAVEIAGRGVMLASFGDLLKVPGSRSSLQDARAEGADLRVVYSPSDALDLARTCADREVVFLAVGFETTAPATATVLLRAKEDGISNFSLLCAHKLIPPAMRALAGDPALTIDGFLCPGHVSVVLGSGPYKFLADDHGRPAVITGFEPLDVLDGIARCLGQLVEGVARVEIQYSRAVRPEGNPLARKRIEEAYVAADESWRGLGVIPASGLTPREEFSGLDARRRFGVTIVGGQDDPACRCGDVLKGIIEPAQCPLFGRRCTPANPVGACMVSSEGSCAIHYKYRAKA
ncbi:MAG: hydrogenase formation protein HypD, partial [Planctomycetota bacterium]